MTRYLSTAEAAELLDCSDEQVRSICERGEFPNAFRRQPGSPWTIPADEVDAYAATKRKRYLSTGKAAKILGRNQRAICALCEAGAFPNAFRPVPGGHWCIPASEVEVYRAANAQPVLRRKGGAMIDALALVLAVTALIGATISLTTYAELRGCRWPLDVVNAVRDAATGAAHAQDGAP